MGSLATDKKKVLLVIRWPVGGIRTFVRYVYRNFSPERWQFNLVAPDLPEARLLLEDLSGFDIRFQSTEPKPSAATFSLRIASALSRQRYDLVHSHGFTSGMCSALPAFIRRTPHLLTSHDVINEEQFIGVKGKAKKQLMGRMLSLPDMIQSVSHDAQENLLEHFRALGRREEKCVVISNGIEIDRFIHASPRDLRGELGLGDDSFLIGFMGRFMAQKGFRYLVDAIEILKRESLPRTPIVLTFGDGGFIREEKQAIIDRGLKDSFLFMPFTPNVAGTLKGLDILAVPSLWEACPLVPMEAMVAGVPVIGTDCVGLREVLKGSPGKTVPAKDSNALAMALKKELQAPSTALARTYSVEAARRFDVRQQSWALEKLMLQLLRGKTFSQDRIQ